MSYAVVSRRILTPFWAAIERLRATIARVDVVVAEVRSSSDTPRTESPQWSSDRQAQALGGMVIHVQCHVIQILSAFGRLESRNHHLH